MKEQFINEVVAALVTDFDAEEIVNIKNKLSVVVDQYNVEKISTEVAIPNVLPKCYEYYIASKKIEGLSARTLEQYELRIRHFFTYVNKDINDVTANDIRVFLYKYQEERKITNRSLDLVRTVLNAFFSWANAEGYCDKNPCLTIKSIKFQKKQKEALNEIELEKLRSACIALRDKALVEFMFSTGARVSEVINCKIADVDFNRREVTLLGKGNKYRIDYLNAKSVIYLKEYLSSREDNDEHLFVSARGYQPMTKGGVEYIINSIWKNTDIEKKVTPHIIRHTTATLSLKRGMGIEQVQKMLGHSNINTTMVYAEVMSDQVKQSHLNVVV